MSANQGQPMNPLDLFNLGVELRQEGQLSEARQAFLGAAELFRAAHGFQSLDLRAHEARALATAGAVSGEMGSVQEGHELSFNAVNVLLPAFEENPDEHMALMQEACGYYINYCDRLGVREDVSVTERVEAVLNGRR